MAELKIPVDVERLPDYQHLVELLRHENFEACSAIHPEMFASFIFLRLFVDLAYQAEKTNEPGVLTEHGRVLLERSLAGIGPKALELLRKSELLAASATGAEPEPALRCARFAKLNAHLAGNYKPAHLRGADLSAHARRKRQVASAVAQQATLLPSELYRDRAGRPLTAPEINRVLVIIKTVDNCLRKNPARTQHEFSEGLIADAAAVAAGNDDDRLELVYRWLIEHRGHAAVPGTAEQVLAGWDGVWRMAGG